MRPILVFFLYKLNFHAATCAKLYLGFEPACSVKNLLVTILAFWIFFAHAILRWWNPAARKTWFLTPGFSTHLKGYYLLYKLYPPKDILTNTF